LSEECLQKGLSRYEKQINTIKPFQGIVWVQESGLQSTKEALKNSKWDIQLMPPHIE
jgi:hypothetical protein